MSPRNGVGQVRAQASPAACEPGMVRMMSESPGSVMDRVQTLHNKEVSLREKFLLVVSNQK